MAAPRNVNRCIAVAAHGRRCQQTTYRGSPYCWHHTQSRKVWAPSRMQAAVRRPLPAAATPVVTVEPHAVAEVAVTPAPIPGGPLAPVADGTSAAERVAAALSPEQLDALATFLESGADGVFRVDVLGAHVVSARRDRRLIPNRR